MSSRTFDTLETVRFLEAAGIEREQAEAIVQAIGRDGEQNGATLATKYDIHRLENDIHRLEAQVAAKADRVDLYRALWIQGGGIVAILAGLKFLP